MRLGGNPALVGKTVTLNGRLFAVTGVMPPGFNLPLPGVYNEALMDIWLPLDPLGRGENRDRGNTFCYARLRPGVTIAEARAEVKRIAADIASRDPASHQLYTARVDALRDVTTRNFKPILWILFGAAGLLLLITCANVGGLLVARSVARAREIAVRVALGAGLRQLAIQYLSEGLFLALIGAAGGLLITFSVIRVLVAFVGDASARAADISVDWRVLAFALGTAVLSIALASIVPLWQAARTPPNEVLSDGVRSSAGARTRRLSRSLVVGEIALAFVLLSLGAVLTSELFRLTRIAPGFSPDHLLTFELTVAPETIPAGTSRAAYQNRLVEALEAIPGVERAGFVNQLPLDDCCYVAVIYSGEAGARSSDRVSFLPASPGYFRAVKIPLRRGRFLENRDTAEKPLPAVIDETAARLFWPNRDPVGLIGHFGGPNGDPFLVLGVVGDVKNNGLDNETVPEIYLPAAVVDVNPMKFVVRSPLPAKTLLPALRRSIQNVNPAQPIHNVRTMDEIVRGSVALKRAASYVMMFFALAALVMATLGAYGVVSYSVRQRIVEIGTRMALGAHPRQVLRLVVGSGMTLAGWGIAIGGAASIAATWLLMRNFAIHVANGGTGRLGTPGLLPFLLSAAVVAAIGAGSSFFPAWWATLLSPMVAIRDQPGARAARSWFAFRKTARAESALPQESILGADLVDASRHANSYREALAAALESVRASIGAESAMLLESASGEEFRTTIAVPQPDAAVSIPGRGLLLNRLRSYAAPLPIAAGDLETWHRWAREHEPRRLAEIEALRKAGVRLALALRTKEDLAGVLLLGARVGGGDYGHPETSVLKRCGGQFALMLENARLTGRVLEQEKLRRDLALASEVQKRLLARQSLETSAISLAAVSIPARSVGGDYYDLLDLGGGRTGIALADVAGKGVPAALIMSVVQATLRVLSAEPAISLPDLVAKMNHFLYHSTGPGSYATFFYAQFDERGRRLRYINAGHNPPYVLRVSGGPMAMEELSVGGTVIGMFPQVPYEQGTIDLAPGDMLMIFTDGVPEAHNPREEEFGEDRLKCLLRQSAGLPVGEMAARITQELKSWIQDAEQYDDLTFVLMKLR
jgi:putative ABC transport system permease protein